MFVVVVQAILSQVHKRCLLPRLMESLGEPMTVDEERYLRWKKDYLFWRKGGKTSFLNKITSLGGTTPLLLPSASMGILSEL